MLDLFHLDESSEAPIYQQIVNQIEHAVLTGHLREGDYLPSVREFSLKHQINPNTISKAYQLIQGLKLAEPIRGLGLKVVPANSKTATKRKKAILTNSIDVMVKTALSLDISKEDLIREIKERIKVLDKKAGGTS